MSRRLLVLLPLVIASACQSQHLYVATMSGLSTYALPLTASSKASVTAKLDYTPVDAIAVDANGDVAVSHGISVSWYAGPLTEKSAATAIFHSGNTAAAGQLAFAGKRLVVMQNQGFGVFDAPFTASSSAAVSAHADRIGYPSGLAVDSSSNIYVANSTVTDGVESGEVVAFAPPWTGDPIVTPGIVNAVYLGMTAIGDRLYIAANSDSTPQVVVFALPLTATSMPLFTMTKGLTLPHELAADASGNLYVGPLTDGPVTVPSGPLAVFAPSPSAASAPALAFTPPCLALAVGP